MGRGQITQKTQPVCSQGSINTQLGRVIAETKVALHTNTKLASSMIMAGNVLVPLALSLGLPQGRPDHSAAGLRSKKRGE